MATIAQIRAGLKTRLETITGLQVFDYRPGTISPPTAIVARQNTQYNRTFDGADDKLMAITVYVQFGNDRSAEDNLDAFLDDSGSSSIVAAVHADQTLGGIVQYTNVASVSDNGLVPYGASEAQYLAATFTVEIGD